MRQVVAEFDFEAQPGTSELSLVTGEVLTVLQDNIEGGWMEGKNAKGKAGLFPASYVVPYAPSTAPPPMPPPSYAAPPATSVYPSLPPLPVVGHKPQPAAFDDWGSSSFAPAQPTFQAPAGSSSGSGEKGLAAYLPPNRPPSSQMADDFDDDWTDEEEEEEQGGRGAVATRPSVARSQSAGDGRGASTVGGHAYGHAAAGPAGKLKGNINRFSNFVKSGMEAYVLSESGTKSAPAERHEIVLIDGTVRWKPDTGLYNCVIDKPKKETKMKGLKSFIAYSVTSSLSGIQVSRRYKHFDWLHEILSSKYVTIAMPPLPEKQVSGRYEEDLIDHRKHILQLWVDKICRHPVLSKSDVWLHFLTCTEEKQWKTGKRKAERDEFVGGAFLHCVSTPTASLNDIDVERQVEHFARNVRQMEDGSRVLTERLNTYQRLLGGPVKQNWQKLAAAFSQIGHAFKEDGAGAASARISDAMQNTAHHYHVIGEDFETHAKNDIEPVLERLFSYRGAIQRVPDIVNIHKQALTKMRNSENAVVEGKISENQAVKVKHRVDTMSYVVLAEMNHLNAEKADDYKQFMATYLRKQQQFYQNMANQLGELAKAFE